MGVGIVYFAPCSTEAFRERLQTAAIKREQEEEKRAKQRSAIKKYKARGDARRSIEDMKMAKSLGVEMEDLK